MNRTRVLFLAIVGVAVLIVAGAAIYQGARGQGATPLSNAPLEVRVVVALPVEPWVSAAAKQFNEERHTLDGQLIHVTIVPMDGLAAMGRYERGEFGTEEGQQPLPTAWIPDSRYLVELVNSAYKDRINRDVFLTDGEYRARPIAVSLFTWGIYTSRADTLEQKYGEITWRTLHDAAIAPGGWREIGGQPEWGYFKLIVPHPRRNIGGLAAMVAAAGEYYDRPDITVADVTDPAFQAWLKELMGAVTDFSSLGAYPGENLALFGYSAGDGGQLLESDLLINMAGSLNRWEPLRILYPKYVTWFDFPFSVWIGPETTAQQKNAALEFERYLIGKPWQEQAVGYGLRPVSNEVGLDQPNSPFNQWQDRGVAAIVPVTTRMRDPDREVLQTLLRWFDLNVAGR